VRRLLEALDRPTDAGEPLLKMPQHRAKTWTGRPVG